MLCDSNTILSISTLAAIIIESNVSDQSLRHVRSDPDHSRAYLSKTTPLKVNSKMISNQPLYPTEPLGYGLISVYPYLQTPPALVRRRPSFVREHDCGMTIPPFLTATKNHRGRARGLETRHANDVTSG